jgi:short subunit dehydrogenase-like uncharacterized protein
MVTRTSASNSKPVSKSVPKTKPAVTAPPGAKRQARSPSKPQPRKYDVVLYGASGFVGKQTVAYFAQLGHLKNAAGQPLRWALAGRSAAKLEAVKAACGPGAKNADIVVADAHDAKALGQLAQDAVVMLSTAGPFALYGSELVAACVKHGTHYVDITGETPWVHDMIALHHAAAVDNGTRIIPFCGFDSVPSDLGTWLITQTMQEKYGEPCERVKACFTLSGGVNGGTLASALNFMGSDQAGMLADPFLLSPGTATLTKSKSKGKSRSAAGHQDPTGPSYDVDFKAWLGPFFMGPINTRVVRRSADLLTPARGKPMGYGHDFHYQEYLRIGGGPLAAAAATALSVGMFASQLAMTLAPVRALAGKLAPGPGTGPSEGSMNRGSFRCELVGASASGHVVRGRIAGRGDPGNRATTKMVCEAALCLALQLDDLPGGPAKGGLLTPASGLGAVLVARLRDAGMTLEAT